MGKNYAYYRVQFLYQYRSANVEGYNDIFIRSCCDDYLA